jgi:hypothetical protein
MSVEISREFLSDDWPPRSSLCAASVSVVGPGQSLTEVMFSFVVFFLLWIELLVCRLALY